MVIVKTYSTSSTTRLATGPTNKMPPPSAAHRPTKKLSNRNRPPATAENEVAVHDVSLDALARQGTWMRTAFSGRSSYHVKAVRRPKGGLQVGGKVISEMKSPVILSTRRSRAHPASDFNYQIPK